MKHDELVHSFEQLSTQIWAHHIIEANRFKNSIEISLLKKAAENFCFLVDEIIDCFKPNAEED